MAQDIEVLYKKYKKAVVIAAGPNAKDDLDQIRDEIDENTAIIGVNHHADMNLIETTFNCFLDWPSEKTPPEFDEMVNKSGKRVTIHNEWTDYKVPYKLTWVDFGETAMMAVWFACYITDGDVYLCGFDCWQNTEVSHYYKDVPGERKRLNGRPMDQLRRWGRLFHRCHKPDRIKPISGLLLKLKKND
jgi:hypothetical protein